jgi:copper chaperone NosL
MSKSFILISLTFFVSCSNEPQPIKYGSDDCAGCKMTIMDEKFGAEVITNKGKIFKFDDIGCMIGYLKNENISDSEISKKLVIDYLQKNSFINANDAVYYVGEDVHSPMNGNAAAFSNKEAALKFQNGKQGIIMVWNELYKKLK